MEQDREVKKDVKSREDIEFFVKSFYEKAKQDELIGHFFTDIVHLDMARHIPLICDFWEGVLFQKAVYKGNPLVIHRDLHSKSKLEKKHFDRWLTLFDETMDTMHSGSKATLAKTRAVSIATVLQIKLC